LKKQKILFVALFATGFSGIVAEYVLATLATHFIGDSVVQWAMIVSVMLFSMGVGSRTSKNLNKNLFATFIGTEFLLSILVSFSALSTYSLAAFTQSIGIYIYTLATLTGFLIGLELPLAVRINENFEELRFNISSVLEKDYYGSLAGGLFFSFVGLPYFGLTYTPFILGSINLLVAIILLAVYPVNLNPKPKRILTFIGFFLVATILLGAIKAKQIILFGEQIRYKDKIVFSEQTRYQKIVITEWKDNYWLYLNNNLQLSTVDEELYHEALIHPAMQLAKEHFNILILGGGDGLAAREILKYPDVKTITVVDLDPRMTDLALNHPILLAANDSSFHDPRVNIINKDGYKYMAALDKFFDVIIVDLPDPRDIELSRLYSLEFYKFCYKHLRNKGVIITQAGSPYYAAESFLCIGKTMAEAGFTNLPLHNEILTMGHWGWQLGVKPKTTRQIIIQKLRAADFDSLNTSWINNEAIGHITSFGKDFYRINTDSIKINKIHDPVLYKYFLKASWDLY
jgi:spermidine synthase